MTDNTNKMPDVTMAQVLSVVATIVGLCVSQGLIDSSTEKTVSGIAAVVVPAAWMIADAIIRMARNKHRAAITVAQITANSGAPAPLVTATPGVSPPVTTP